MHSKHETISCPCAGVEFWHNFIPRKIFSKCDKYPIENNGDEAFDGRMLKTLGSRAAMCCFILPVLRANRRFGQRHFNISNNINAQAVLLRRQLIELPGGVPVGSITLQNPKLKFQNPVTRGDKIVAYKLFSYVTNILVHL